MNGLTNPSKPWRLAALALLTSLLLALAMPGRAGWYPLLFLALVPLLTACLYLSPGRSALTGLAVGMGYYPVLLYWIVIVLSEYGGLPHWLALAALGMLALYMSLYLALFCFLLSRAAGRSWQRERPLGLFVWLTPLLWVGLDQLRTFLFTGFPWMDLAYGLAFRPELIQAAELGGHHLVTFALVLCNSLLVALIDRQRRQVQWQRHQERRLLMAACGLLVFVFGYSTLRYRSFPAYGHHTLTASVTVVQGNIDQHSKWTPRNQKATVTTYEHLSSRGMDNHNIDLLVWPETAMPFYLQQHPLGREIAAYCRQNNIWLLTGAPSYAFITNQNNEKIPIYLNSALLLAPDGKIHGEYAKQHLVPFGEYVPLGKLLPFLSPLVVNSGNFSAGRSSIPLNVGRLRLGILICYESIFPEISRQEVRNQANVLVNISNDGWYGRSSAPYQSLAMAVFRAVENRRPLVRAANTGVSAFIDPRGTIRQQTGIFEPATLTDQVPLMEQMTFFDNFGYIFGILCLGVAGLIVLRRAW